MSEQKTLATELPKEQARCCELLAAYKQIPTGGFGAAMIEASLREADEAAVSGDLVRMIAAYQRLKAHE
jgi:hypothetical protein